jgi:hypothetical protein
VWTTIALSVPLYALYELSVLASYVIYRRKNRRAASRGRNGGPPNGDSSAGPTAPELDEAEHSGAPA